MFVTSIDRKERMAIGIKIEDKDDANGLTEDWAEVKRVCRRHDGKLTREPNSRETMDEVEVAFQGLRTNDVANTKIELQHVGTTGEGVEQAIFSSFKITTIKDKADDLRVTSRVVEVSRTRLLETSSDEGVSIIEACMIEEDNKCEAYRVNDVVVNETCL